MFIRDLFYQDPVLFGSQDSLDSLIDDAAVLIQVPRSQLHVVCSPDQQSSLLACQCHVSVCFGYVFNNSPGDHNDREVLQRLKKPTTGTY